VIQVVEHADRAVMQTFCCLSNFLKNLWKMRHVKCSEMARQHLPDKEVWVKNVR